MLRRFMLKRWLDFRMGHGVYLAFFMSLVNFVIITYSFAIEKNSYLHGTFTSMTTFALFFIAVYIPGAMLVGYWHRRHQYRVEAEVSIQEDWISAWIFRYFVRLVQDK